MNRLRLLSALVVLHLATAMAGLAASNLTVRMVAGGGQFLFSPTNALINAGDTITWTNAHNGAPHDTTAGLTNSGTNNGWTTASFSAASGITFTFVFSNAGYFPYRCRIHADFPPGSGQIYHPEQTGSVMVVSAGVPPSVSITNPAGGDAFRVGSNVAVNVSATDDGAVTLVELLTNGALASSLTGPNFDFNLSFPAAGNFTLTARATDDGGLMNTSAPVDIFILTNAILTNFMTLTNGQVQFQVLGIAGQTYFIDASTDLSVWAPIVTNVAPSNLFPVLDAEAASNALRFYRSRQLSF